MRKKLKGGMETIIAIVIITGVVVAIIVSTVIPMAGEGDKTIDAATSALVSQQATIGPQ